jgi:hypothetical protein
MCFRIPEGDHDGLAAIPGTGSLIQPSYRCTCTSAFVRSYKKDPYSRRGSRGPVDDAAST